MKPRAYLQLLADDGNLIAEVAYNRVKTYLREPLSESAWNVLDYLQQERGRAWLPQSTHLVRLLVKRFVKVVEVLEDDSFILEITEAGWLASEERAFLRGDF